MKKSILYIISNARSGSTLLEYLLSSNDNTISVGELNNLDSHLNHGRLGKTWGWKCSCGEDFDKCSFWRKVFDELRARDIDYKNRTSIYENDRNIFTKLISIKYDHILNKPVIDLLNNIYDVIFQDSGIQLIVDSSKNPLQGLALYKNLNADVKIIYLKRDIRAVVFSMQKWEKKHENKNSSLFKLLIISIAFHLKSRRCLQKVSSEDKYHLTYEKLAKYPQQAIDELMTYFGYASYPTPEYMEYTNRHSVGGTPTRFEKRKIEYDDSWITKAKKRPVFSFLAKQLDKLI